jgi:hypothetical protein
LDPKLETPVVVFSARYWVLSSPLVRWHLYDVERGELSQRSEQDIAVMAAKDVPLLGGSGCWMVVVG